MVLRGAEQGEQAVQARQVPPPLLLRQPAERSAGVGCEEGILPDVPPQVELPVVELWSGAAS